MDIRKKNKDFIFMKKNLLLGAALAVAFCAMVVFAIISNIGEAKALEVEVSDTSYELKSHDTDITLKVSNGTYTISGGSTRWENVSINVVPADRNVKDVTIILDNVNIVTSKDKYIINLNAPAADVTGNYKILVKGTCNLESTRKASRYALITTQNVNASLVKLSESEKIASHAKLSHLLTEVSVIYKTTLTISNYKSSSSTPSVLSLVTSTNGYGAAIGGGEATVDVGVVLSPGKSSTTFSPYYYLDENGNNIGQQSAYEYLNAKYGTNYTETTRLQLGKEFLVGTSVNAADITIDGEVELNILNKGYGAGIGGGGSDTITNPAGNAGKVKINSGTVAIQTNNIGPCIGSGRNSVTGAAGNGNIIEINGGSLYMNAASDQNDGAIQNNEGKKLYLFEIDLYGIGGFKTTYNDVITIEDSKYSNSYSANTVLDGTRGEISIDIIGYNYVGYGHSNSSSAGIVNNIGDKLFFYLPATPTAELTISANSYISSTQNIKIYQNDAEVLPENGAFPKYTLDAGRMVDVLVYDVPSSIEVTGIMVGESGYPVTQEKDAYGEVYYTTSFKMPETATQISVIYGGDIPVVYHSGIASDDTTAHSYSNNASTTYKYGESFILSEPSTSDLIFDGWYIGDKLYTEISVQDILDGSVLTNGQIELTAKWKTAIEYFYTNADGEEKLIRIDEIPYGTSYTLNPDDSQLPNPPEVEFYDFIGWSVDGTTYTKESGNSYYKGSVYSTLKVEGLYKKNRFYVYVDEAFFNATNVTILMGSQALPFEANVVTEGGRRYYRTLVTEAVSNVTMNVTSKRGYQISPMNWSVSISGVKSFTDMWSDNAVAYTLGLDKNDVFVVNNNSTFIATQYSIKFFDGIDSTVPWKTYTYTIEDITFPASINSILGEDAIAITTRNDRFHSFVGWKSNIANGESDPVVTSIEDLGNYIFVGTWKEVSRYPIDITVYDSETNEVSDVVKVIPYLYDEILDSMAEITIEEVVDETTGETHSYAYVIPEDKIYFEFVAIDEDGDFIYNADGSYRIVEIGKGIEFAASGEAPNDYSFKYEYLSTTNEDTTKKIRDSKQIITVPKDVNEDSVLKISIRIKLTTFTIQYWDVRGYDNTSNPLTYTIFDEFNFKDLIQSQVGWLLVIQDNDDANYDEVTTTPIKGVSKWSFGNMVLKADWPADFKDIYNITIDVNDTSKGTISIIYPVVTDGYKVSESVLINVAAVKGYQLVPNTLVYTKVLTTPVSLFNVRGLKDNLPLTDYIIPAVSADKGMYMFAMPDSDIIVSAKFEPITYYIDYNEVDEKTINDNPTTYTVEDTIVLLAPSKKGYKFTGWKDNAGNTVTEISSMTGNIALTAGWESIEEPTTPTTEPEKDTKKGTQEENPTNQTNNQGDQEETTVKDQYVGGNGGDSGQDNSQLQTGDKTNVTKIIIICVIAAVLLLVVVIKKKDSKDDGDDDEK